MISAHVIQSPVLTVWAFAAQMGSPKVCLVALRMSGLIEVLNGSVIHIRFRKY